MIPIITRILPVARATPPEKFVKIRRQLFELSRGQIDGQRRKRNIFGGCKKTLLEWRSSPAGRPAGLPARYLRTGMAHLSGVGAPYIHTRRTSSSPRTAALATIVYVV